MRFAEFLRTTVLISAAAASVLAAVTLAGAAGASDNLIVPVAAGWWVLAGLIGSWFGRRGETSPPIASLLASARMQMSLPELNPSRTVLNRLWPLLLCTVGAGALGFVLPQVPAIATGRGNNRGLRSTPATSPASASASLILKVIPLSR